MLDALANDALKNCGLVTVKTLYRFIRFPNADDAFAAAVQLIEKLRALKLDDNADVANLIGYSSRKLGRYADSKYWYEKALTADPRHARTWSYYGMWHAEQGNTLKALDYLTTVRGICGTECREYVELKGVIEGTRTY